ncbi:uncharacterized protein [Amphiura filiformis]|uniref:uncharacterized protein n=1 Tax=Amphiura filiformis TaxID=82378 RepID=UPI003B2185EF
MYTDNGAWFLVIFIIFLCIQQSYPASTERNKKAVSASTQKLVLYRSMTTTDADDVDIIQVSKRGQASARRSGGRKSRGRWRKAKKRTSGVGRGGISGFIAFGLVFIVLVLLVAIFLTWRYRGRSSKRRTIEHEPLPTAEFNECIIME